MDEQQETILKKGRLIANPHYYDYLHALDFQDNHIVKLLDGGGQVFNMIALAKYTITHTMNECFTIKLYDFIEQNPYSNKEKALTISPKTYTIKKEKGIFIFRCEVVWKIHDEQEWPCLLFHERYVFDSDPLSFANERQQFNLYNVLEQKVFTHSVRYYYPQQLSRELPLKELQKRGFEKALFWENGVYEDVEAG